MIKKVLPVSGTDGRALSQHPGELLKLHYLFQFDLV